MRLVPLLYIALKRMPSLVYFELIIHPERVCFKPRLKQNFAHFFISLF